MSLQKERPEEERALIEAEEQRLKRLLGSGYLFADAIIKFIQKLDSEKKKDK